MPFCYRTDKNHAFKLLLLIHQLHLDEVAVAYYLSILLYERGGVVFSETSCAVGAPLLMKKGILGEAGFWREDG
jgi:hypothetical protein